MKKLKKKGKVGKTEAGELVLMNEGGQIFKTDEVVVSIWDMCDGTVTSENLAKEVSQKTKQEESVVRETIEGIVGEMEKVGLMESVE